MTRVYSIVLTHTPTGYVVSVPDLGIDTQGADLAEAIYMARDAIGLWGISEEDDGRTIPESSTEIPPHEPNELVSWVDIDFSRYRKTLDMTTIRINVTLPKYLKVLGDEAGVNFSRELQERLKERLASNL